MPGFDWRTEEKEPWREATPATQINRPGPIRRWLKIGGSLLLLGLAIFFIYRQVNKMIDQAVAEVRDYPVASLELIQQAVAASDEELFTLFLSTGNADWYDGQQALFAQDLFFDRRPFGLQVVAGDPQLINVDLSPDLTRAEITYQLTYTGQHGLENSPAVTLQQTAWFQLDPERWVMAPPGINFWGGWERVGGERVTLIVPERDLILGQRLARDLDSQLNTMCRELTGIECPAGQHIVIRLEKSPASLAQMAGREATLLVNGELSLPAPSLVGRPVDETGYQALYRGYAIHTVTAVISELTGNPCCRETLFYQALLAKQLSQLELQPWPLTTADYDTILSRYFKLSPFQASWRAASPDNLVADDSWRVYTFVEFLAESNPDMPLAEMQRRLADSSSYLTWARHFRDGTDVSLKSDWMRFVYEKTTAAQLPPPIPTPDQEIRLYCLSASHHQLFQYQWDIGHWSAQHSLDPAIDGLISPLPGRDGLILYEHDSAIANQMWTIWKPEEAAVTLPVDLEPVFYAVHSSADAAQEWLLTGRNNPQLNLFQFTLLDLAQCNALHCELVPLPGLPVWSPDGTHTIVNLAHDRNGWFQLALGDSKGQTLNLLESGSLPFWIDNETYGYLRHGPDQAELVVRTLDSDVLLFRLTPSDLLPALPEEERQTALSIRRVMGHPENPQLLFIDAAAPALKTQYIFSVRWPVNEVSMVLQLDDQASFIDFRYAPDGRRWALSTFNRSDPVDATWSVYVHDIGREKITFLSFNPIPYPAYSLDWSADGRWFLKVEDGVITLVAPDYDYFKMMFFDTSFCTSAVWVHNRVDKSAQR